ncbi:site-specific DNA-methyltransferase [Pontibacter sp. H249]|uniref:site-specific DNA-methyltransferase n=1 Tax=Pontibacter sp. H249 TaxID=3133420 RepID=UPI0030C10D61
MSRLTDLIANAKAKDPQLGADLEREFRALSSRLSFGLNFERHRPEAVELPNRPVRRGDKVRVLTPRGSTAKGDQRLWLVRVIHKTSKTADLELLGSAGSETQAVALDDLVVVAEFRDTIYPGLLSTGKVSRGGDKPCHTVINGENYHVLKALTWTHRGKVDAIYIDPPYNTGARDWKYNNNYVEKEDLYRHSKWLAMMERRLLLAKELLNPEDSVLIVTIDEKEYLRLGLLLEQTYPEARIQMVSIVINGQGSSRIKAMSRVDEYAYFVYIGNARPEEVPLETLASDDSQSQIGAERIWFSLIRGGKSGVRSKSYESFYPIYVNEKLGVIEGFGKPLPKGLHPNDAEMAPKGCVAVWPISKKGVEGRWQMGVTEFEARLKAGYIRVGKPSNGVRWPITYIREGTIERIKNGELIVQGHDLGGALVLANDPENPRGRTPKTVWYLKAHNSGTYGTDLLENFIPGRYFPFPKSLYAVEDALRYFVKGKPKAIVLDFFSGSGTTAHAVMRLNKQDGGRRQCISVTNNEVAADEQKALREKGLRPGSAEWEQWGICDYITKPRVEAAITGRTPDGKPIKGDYTFTDEFPMSDGLEENAEFFTLTYETPTSVSYQTDSAFARIAPLLWLRAGSVGRRIDEVPTAGWDIADVYGLLVDLDKANGFLKALQKTESIRIAYIVTDDERRFQALARSLPAGVEAIRLYESYLTNFAFENGNNS